MHQNPTTPKRIEHYKSVKDSKSSTFKKRVALFPNSNQNTSESVLDVSVDSSRPLNSFDFTPLKELRKNCSYSSPVSPLYRRQSDFASPKNRSFQQSTPATNERLPSNLRLSDFITPSKSSGKKKAQRNLAENSFW